MAGLKHLFDIYNTKGREFVENLFSSFVTINEKMDASAFLLKKNAETGELEYFKKSDKTPISKIDRALAKYYEQAIQHFEGLHSRTKNRIPKDWVFGFEYFVDTNPVEIKYDEIPENHLILSYIHIKDKNGKIQKTIQEKADLDAWASTLKVNKAPIIFQGHLSDDQKIKILDFLETPFDKLVQKFQSDSFVEFIIKILAPRSKRTTLNSDLQKSIEGIVFRFGKEENEEVSLAKLVDPVFTQLAKNKSKEKRTFKPNDIYNMTIIDLMNYMNMVNLNKHKPKGRGFDDRYISFISSVFNSFIEEEGEEYKGLDFDPPKYLQKSHFDLGEEFISNPKTIELVNLNPSFKQLFKIMLAAFRKKRRRTTPLFTKELIDQFNLTIEKIHNHIVGLRESEGMVSFGEYLSDYDHEIEEAEEDEAPFYGSEDFQDKYTLDSEPITSDQVRRGKKKVNIMVGRFQPFHNGHMKMAEALYEHNKRPVVVVVVHPGHNKSGESPFTVEALDAMFENLPIDSDGIIECHKFIKTGFVGDVVEALRPNYEPICWGAGADRLDGFEAQLKYNKAKNNELNLVDEFVMMETPRSLSGTDIRKIIQEEDFTSFKKMVPKSIQSQWMLVKKYFNEAQMIKESMDNMEPGFGLTMDPFKNQISTLHLMTMGNVETEEDYEKMLPNYQDTYEKSKGLKYFHVIERKIHGDGSGTHPLNEFNEEERRRTGVHVERFLLDSKLGEYELKLLAETIDEKIGLPNEIIEGQGIYELNWEQLTGDNRIKGIIEFLQYQIPKDGEGKGELPLAFLFKEGKLPRKEGDLIIEDYLFEVKNGENMKLQGFGKGFNGKGKQSLKILRDFIQDRTSYDIFEGNVSLDEYKKYSEGEDTDREIRKKLLPYNFKNNNIWTKLVPKIKDKAGLKEAFVDYFCERWTNLRANPELLKEVDEFFVEFVRSGQHRNGFSPLVHTNMKYYQVVEKFKGLIVIKNNDKKEIYKTLFVNPDTLTLQEFMSNFKPGSFNWNHESTGKAFEFATI